MAQEFQFYLPWKKIEEFTGCGSQVAQVALVFFRVMASLLRPPFHSIGTSEERPPRSSIFCSKQRQFPHSQWCLSVFAAFDHWLIARTLSKISISISIWRTTAVSPRSWTCYGQLWLVPYFCRVNQLQFGISCLGQGFLYLSPIGQGVSGDSHVIILYSNGFTSHWQGMQTMETLALEPRSCKAIARTDPSKRVSNVVILTTLHVAGWDGASLGSLQVQEVFKRARYKLSRLMI